ncbi:MAG: DUF523 domain-containing protein [Clostridia bacterium]|nr:DUF523 domain-containing protein [Clostridia bacterium]
MRILISACLLGIRCRYDGGSKPCGQVLLLGKKHVLIPVCPEQLGGLPTPRIPCERIGDRVIARDGTDRTDEYRTGAEEALKLYSMMHCEYAVLKARSPSCGCGRIYDGTFSGALKNGNGVLAEMLLEKGIRVLTEEELDGTDI